MSAAGTVDNPFEDVIAPYICVEVVVSAGRSNAQPENPERPVTERPTFDGMFWWFEEFADGVTKAAQEVGRVAGDALVR